MKKGWIILGAVIILIAVIRIILPFVLVRVVNNIIKEDVKDYNGSIEDIDLSILRGAYSIKNLRLEKTDSSVIPVPFVSIDKIRMIISWKDLFRGTIEGNVTFYRPVINFAITRDNTGKEVIQAGTETDWVKVLRDMTPFRINEMHITGGEIYYKNYTTDPDIDVFLNDLSMTATNLYNRGDTVNTLPSEFKVYGTSIGGGILEVNARANVMKEIPDMDLNMSFENMDMTAINKFLRPMIKADIEKGKFSLYTEIAVKDNNVKGYIKPVMEDMQIKEKKEDEGNFIRNAWETGLQMLTDLFSNKKEDQVASRVPFEGSITNEDIGVLPGIWNIFINAFVGALSKKVEGSIALPESIKGNEKEKANKKE